jgi:pimeloyl-ACP methyl ester carboxylesterase
LVVLGAMALLGAARPDAPPQGGVPVIEGLESRSADLGDGLTMHYWIGGHSAPVILLHGWPETGYAWRRIAPLLVAAGFEGRERPACRRR